MGAMAPDPVPGHPEPGMHIWGWMHPPELRWLRTTAEKMESVVEIGSLHGRSAFALLTGCPGPVYCIDPWNDPKGHCLPSFLDSCGGFENLRAIQDFSPAAAHRVIEMNGGPVDMVFIDGDHEYDSCRADIEGWLPHTTKIICGHDYQNADGGFPGVAESVHDIFGPEIENPRDTSIWVVRL